jgi:hypothetical protein
LVSIEKCLKTDRILKKKNIGEKGIMEINTIAFIREYSNIPHKGYKVEKRKTN